MEIKTKIILGLGGMLLIPFAPFAAGATTVSYVASHALSSTSWTDTLSVNQFDTNLGTLLDISVTLTGKINDSIQLESFNSAPATINANLMTDIILSFSAGSIITQVIPFNSCTLTATAYDGKIDFGGTSGKTFTNLTASASSTSHFAASPNGDPFLGTGSVMFSLEAYANFQTIGTGNWVKTFSNQAEADVLVTYTYMPNFPRLDQAPEPTTMLLFGSGLVGLVGIGLRRKK